MATSDDVVSAIYRYVFRILERSLPRVIFAQWVAAETLDANLSQITADSQTFRFVPKFSHVTGLVAGDSLVCIKFHGIPMIIFGKIVGDVTQSEA